MVLEHLHCNVELTWTIWSRMWSFFVGPTVLLAMEKAIENTKLNDRAMHYHFIALKQEWLGYVSYFTLYSDTSANEDNSFRNHIH